ncbi:MAG: GTPase Der [Parcubacteria group bacterium GW2011_GWC2_39_14]|nr:MAG: GTPase Der [Parcubacteria group bacterium GW2011_GWC2_39_14]KKR54927.1 MAG: GTPase Der [Parcubacteria group bacterium GW2011_GWA2_40_23]
MRHIIENYPLVALVGRTNVGKSTIFNRLIGDKKALVSSIAGTTRDQRVGICSWQNRNIQLCDTAGLDISMEEEIDRQSIKKAGEMAQKAELVLLVVDVRHGLLPQDREYAQKLKKWKKKVFLVVNKVDSNKQLSDVNDFYRLGFKDVFVISAKTGAGTGDLLDAVTAQFSKTEMDEKPVNETIKEIKIAIIGKPNVGKSSLINKIIGEERAIVSSVAHTTRDSQDLKIEYADEKNEIYYLTFIDTAGIVKHRKITDKLKEQSIEQSFEMIRNSDIVFLVLDGSDEITVQDKTLAGEILENNKSLIFVINKWDLLPEKDTHSDKTYIEFLHGHFPYLTWAPIIFVSAKTGFKIDRLVKIVLEIYHNQNKVISDDSVNELLTKALHKQMPRVAKGVAIPVIDTLKQVKTNPQTFEITAKNTQSIHFSYRRFIQNQLREKYKLAGCGIRIRLEEREDTRKIDAHLKTKRSK